MVTIDDLTPIIEKTVTSAVEKAVKDALKTVVDRLDTLETKVTELTNLKVTLTSHTEQIKDLDKSINNAHGQIDSINNKIIPDLDKKFTNITTKMCMNILDLDTHRRKWSLIVNGLQSNPGETEMETRAKVRTFAVDKLNVEGADSHSFGACHRLSQTAKAGIIIRFNDLQNRNSWLANAKNLKNSSQNVTLSPDLHPVLRPLKADILKVRKNPLH